MRRREKSIISATVSVSIALGVNVPATFIRNQKYSLYTNADAHVCTRLCSAYSKSDLNSRVYWKKKTTSLLKKYLYGQQSIGKNRHYIQLVEKYKRMLKKNLTLLMESAVFIDISYTWTAELVYRTQRISYRIEYSYMIRSMYEYAKKITYIRRHVASLLWEPNSNLLFFSFNNSC